MKITGHCVVNAFQVCLEDMMSILKQISDWQDVPVYVVVSECATGCSFMEVKYTKMNTVKMANCVCKHTIYANFTVE